MGDNTRPSVNSETMYSDVGSNPARDAAVITPNDTTVLSPAARALRVGNGASGSLTIITPRGNSVLFDNIQDGETIPCGAIKVMATGTDVTNIVAYYG